MGLFGDSEAMRYAREANDTARAASSAAQEASRAAQSASEASKMALELHNRHTLECNEYRKDTADNFKSLRGYQITQLTGIIAILIAVLGFLASEMMKANRVFDPVDQTSPAQHRPIR